MGAAPAGSACAQMLAAAGLDVCWSTSTTSARQGLRRRPDPRRAPRAGLGVYDEVMAQRRPVRHVGCIGSAVRGGRVDVPGRSRCCRAGLTTSSSAPRTRRVRAAARPPSARPNWPPRARGRARGSISVGRRTSPARLGGAGHRRGAAGAMAAGVRPPHAQRHGAARLRAQRGAARPHHERWRSVWHPRGCACRRLRLDLSRPRRRVQHRRRPHRHPAERRGDGTCRDLNLRQMFDAFCEVYAPARELMATGGRGEMKGAPLRCSLDGRAQVAPRPAGHRRSRRQHLRLQRRRHRQGDGDRPAGRRGRGQGSIRASDDDGRGVRALTKPRAGAETALRASTNAPTASTTTPGWPTW